MPATSGLLPSHARLTLIASVFLCSLAAALSDLAKIESEDSAPFNSATNFDGTSILRVELRFERQAAAARGTNDASSSCVPILMDVRPISPKRTPHTWHLVPEPTAVEWSGPAAYRINVTDAVNAAAPQDFTPTAPLTAEKEHIQRLATFNRDGETFAHAFLDPRHVRHHSGHHEDHHVQTMMGRLKKAFKKLTGTDETQRIEAHTVRDYGVDAFWVPSDVQSIDIYCGRTMANVTRVRLDSIPHSHARHFAAQAGGASASPEVRTLSAAGPPSTQYNIIFLSGGYRAQDYDMFWANATNLTNLLADWSLDQSAIPDPDGDLSSMRRSVPLNRYWLSWNVYAVYQQSVDNGANRPALGLAVNNNLGCTHPASMERAVYCDQALAYALASMTPADVYGSPDRCVVINIVNTALYGGSAISVPGKFHMGNFFNGFDLNDISQKKRMMSLVDHEAGHAIGSLFDEYSIGITQPVDPGLLNCQMGNADGSAPTSLKWQRWLDIINANPSTWMATYGPSLTGTNWGVLAVPQAVCGYTNFYKPNSNCMMQRLNDFYMCPVCRESELTSLFRVNFSLAWPRYPLEDVVTVIAPATETSVLNENGELVLHLANHLTRGFTVTLTDVDGTTIPALKTPKCYNCFVLNSVNFAKYPIDQVVSLKATITDNTDHFLSPTILAKYPAQLTQTTTFRVVRVSTVASWQARKKLTLSVVQDRPPVGVLTTDITSAWTYCEGVDPTKNATLVCSMSFPNRTYPGPPPRAAFLSQYDGWILIVLGVVAFLFLLLWGWGATAYSDSSNGRVRPIFKTDFNCFVGLVRRIMQLSAVLFLVASVATIGLAAFYYFQATSLGKIALIAGVVMAIILYILAFIGYWAIASRSKRMLLFNGGCLFIAFGVMTTVFAIVVLIGQELQVEKAFVIDMGQVGSVVGVPTVTQAQPANVTVPPATTSTVAPRGTAGPATSSAPVSASDQSGYWTNQLHSLWQYEVSSDPNTACSLQDMLQCSGFYTNCAGQFQSALDCPSGCDDVNQKHQEPCLTVFKRYIIDNYVYIAGISGGAAGLLVAGLAFNFILFFGLLYMKRRIQSENENRISKKLKECQAASASGGGGGSAAPKGKALYLLKSIDSSSHVALIREFKRIDKDGNGELDRKELYTFFVKCLCYKPSAAELEEIYSIADKDGDGTISLVEFLKLFGPIDEAAAQQLASSVASPRRAPRAVGITQIKAFGSKVKGAVKGKGEKSSAPLPPGSRGEQQLATPILEVPQHHHEEHQQYASEVPHSQQQQPQRRAPAWADDLL